MEQKQICNTHDPIHRKGNKKQQLTNYWKINAYVCYMYEESYSLLVTKVQELQVKQNCFYLYLKMDFAAKWSLLPDTVTQKCWMGGNFTKLTEKVAFRKQS